MSSSLINRRTVLTTAVLAPLLCAQAQASVGIERRSFTTSDGVPISYLIGGRGRPVLLLHGLLVDAQSNWFDTGVAQRIMQRGAMVIAPDFRGHGKSGKPIDPGAYPTDVLARDQEELLRHLRIRKYNLSGYSLGARMCVRLMVRGSRPSRACLGGMGDTGIIDVDPGRLAFEDLVINGAQAKNPVAGAAIQATMRRFGDGEQQILGVLRQQISTPPAALRAIDTPILLVCGDRDLDSGSVPSLAAMFPHATMQRVPGTHREAPSTEEFKRVVAEFLAV
jgi:pimeloyl-ACP methyl ester carboxylesterase